jgi:hypothetical protein
VPHPSENEPEDEEALFQILKALANSSRNQMLQKAEVQ